MKQLRAQDIKEGLQVLVDGVPAVIHDNEFFAPGSPKPPMLLGRFVGQWVECFLKEREMQIWNRSHTSLFGTRYCVVGGTPRQADDELVIEADPRSYEGKPAYYRPIIRKVNVGRSVAEGRVTTNDDPATHIDVQAWIAAFDKTYSES